MKIDGDTFFVKWSNEDVFICERLIAAYKNTKNQNNHIFLNLIKNDLWDVIDKDKKISNLKTFLEEGDALKLSKHFIEYWSEPAWYGGIDTMDSLDSNTATYNELIKLSKTINLNEYDFDTVDDIVDRVSNFLDINIIPPPVISVNGLKTKNGILHYRHINSLYFSMLIKKFTNTTHNICEYGGGLGLNAYYLYKMNRKNVYMFDLPFVNTISAYFLIKALSHDAIVLEGEPSKPDAIHIKAFWNCDKYSENFFEVSANQDSFPEIDVNIVKKYFDIITHNTKSYFLSINHETESIFFNYGKTSRHLNVSKILSWLYVYKLISRINHPLRNGYFEEIYKINKI